MSGYRMIVSTPLLDGERDNQTRRHPVYADHRPIDEARITVNDAHHGDHVTRMWQVCARKHRGQANGSDKRRQQCHDES